MRLVAENGDQLGIQPVAEALRMAEEKNVDLVEIAPLANPPVCKLMDYGKFRYREQKKAHEAKLKQKQIQVKEIKFRPGTDEGDYKIKLGKLIEFLEEGDKAKVTLRFRGREMAHKEFGERGAADGDGAVAEEKRRCAGESGQTGNESETQGSAEDRGKTCSGVIQQVIAEASSVRVAGRPA